MATLSRLLSRCVVTAVKLPVAAAWDALSLGNFGEGTSTGRVIDQHKKRARFDNALDYAEDVEKLHERSR